MERTFGVVLLFQFFLLLSPTFSIDFSNVIDLWCSKAPFPDTCKYFFHNGYTPRNISDFKKTVLQITMERAISAENHAKGMGSKCRNEKEKAAWADCLELFQNTILQLNQTLDFNSKCTKFDIQTWLSTALTNLETCQAGFAELNVTDYVLPLIMSNNVTKLIRNSLAINKVSTLKGRETYEEGFPSWVSPGDRKLLQSSSTVADLVVARDGSGDYKTVQAAIEEAAKRKKDGRLVIHVKRGIYNENILIGNNLKNIMLVGDGMRYTIITGNRSVVGGSTTFNSSTLAVTGERFIAQGITFRNTAGPENHQAVALRSGSDLSVFYRCGFEGYQDTLYVHSQRQFYKECYIYGTVDFIFGNAAVVLQNCMIYARKPMNGQKNAVTAQGRTDPNQNTGISIHNSRVLATDDLKLVQDTVKTYLGRPWKEYSRTVFMRTYLDNLIDPAGWLEWNGDFALNTLYYGEYKNMGPRSSTNQRVNWKGYQVINSSTEASKFTVQSFIEGQSWLPGTGVPFTSGL